MEHPGQIWIGTTLIGGSIFGRRQQAVSLPPSKTSLENHAAYIGSWLKLLREDKAEIFRAAALAQKAADYLCERAMRHAPRQPSEASGDAKCEAEDAPAAPGLSARSKPTSGRRAPSLSIP